MSRGMNKIQLIGNLGRDPEMRFTPSGKPVTEFSLAVSRRPRQGETQGETDWFRIICWDRLAEIADQYLKKGNQVYIDGRLQIRRYTNNEGQERTSVEVVANEMLMLGSRADREGGYREQDSGSSSGSSGSGGSGNFDDSFDDVPF